MTRRGPNEGSIHQRKDGRWVGSVHLGYEPGRRVRKHVFGRTRADVVEKLKPLLKARDEQRPVPDQRLKVGTYLRTWLEDVARPTIRVSTYERYKDIVELHLVPGLGHIRLAKLSPADVQAFLMKKHESGLSARRVQMLHAILRRALRIAKERGYVSRNVARIVGPPRVPRKEIEPLTPEQAGVLIASSKEHRLHALWVTAVGTGLRQGELLGLRWEDVVTRTFQRALKAAGLPHRRFHDLRHSAATFLLAQGFTLEDVKNLLGHSSIVLTSNTYGHVFEQRQVALGMDAVLSG